MAPLDCLRAGLVVGVWEWEYIGGVLVAGNDTDGRKEDVVLVLATEIVIN